MDALDPITRLILRTALGAAGIGCIVGAAGMLFRPAIGVVILGVILIVVAVIDRHEEMEGR